MKYLILAVITSMMCTGCLTEKYVEKMQDFGPQRTNITLTGDISGGLSEDGESVILRDCFRICYKLKKKHENNYQVYHEKIKIKTPLPVYRLGLEPPANVAAYINIKSQNEDQFILELKTADSPLQEIVAEEWTNNDAHYFKRARLAVAIPFVVVGDVVLETARVTGIGGVVYVVGVASFCVLRVAFAVLGA